MHVQLQLNCTFGRLQRAGSSGLLRSDSMRFVGVVRALSLLSLHVALTDGTGWRIEKQFANLVLNASHICHPISIAAPDTESPCTADTCTAPDQALGHPDVPLAPLCTSPDCHVYFDSASVGDSWIEVGFPKNVYATGHSHEPSFPCPQHTGLGMSSIGSFKKVFETLVFSDPSSCRQFHHDINHSSQP